MCHSRVSTMVKRAPCWKLTSDRYTCQLTSAPWQYDWDCWLKWVLCQRTLLNQVQSAQILNVHLPRLCCAERRKACIGSHCAIVYKLTWVKVNCTAAKRAEGIIHRWFTYCKRSQSHWWPVLVVGWAKENDKAGFYEHWLIWTHLRERSSLCLKLFNRKHLKCMHSKWMQAHVGHNCAWR